MRSFLKLIRYPNLLLLAFMQLVFRFGFLKFQNIPLALADWQYLLLVVSTVLLAAGGYVINNIFDQNTDHDNKPESVVVGGGISESSAYTIYMILTFSGVGLGFYLSNVIGKPGFAAIFILIAATLYIYASALKQMLLIGNIIVALLLSFSLLIVGVFDLYPATYEGNQIQMATVFSILMDYAFFAFMINMLREMVKDMEDYEGDFNQGMRTLAIVFGVSRTRKLVFVLSFMPLIVLLRYINNYFIANNLLIMAVYSLLFIAGPLFFFIIRIAVARSAKDFHRLSIILKYTLLFGVVSVALLTYTIKHHA